MRNPFPMFIRRWLMIFIPVIALGCAPNNDSGTPSGCASPFCKAPELPRTEKPLKFEILEEPEPGRYALRLILSSNEANEFHLYRTFTDKGEVKSELMAHFRQPKSEITLEHQSSGAVFDLVLAELTAGNQEQAVQSLKITLPKDVIVSSHVDAKDLDLTNVSRFYLLPGAMVSTFGKDFKIQVTKLIAEKGSSLEAFPNASQAPDNQAGQGGGRIDIEADLAKGDLEINLRGQDGGKWTEEPPSLASNEAYRGVRGTNGAPSVMACPGIFGGGPICVCLRQPGAGGGGSDGKPGFTGLKGLSGGDSGSLNVIIKNGSAFTLFHHRVPGQGGLSSFGGIGGPGGFGGAPGSNTPTLGQKACADAPAGPQGKVGPRGTNGIPGVAGKIGQVCLKLSESSGTDCM